MYSFFFFLLFLITLIALKPYFLIMIYINCLHIYNTINVNNGTLIERLKFIAMMNRNSLILKTMKSLPYNKGIFVDF